MNVTLGFVTVAPSSISNLPDTEIPSPWLISVFVSVPVSVTVTVTLPSTAVSTLKFWSAGLLVMLLSSSSLAVTVTNAVWLPSAKSAFGTSTVYVLPVTVAVYVLSPIVTSTS